jgi:hypothetical protein
VEDVAEADAHEERDVTRTPIFADELVAAQGESVYWIHAEFAGRLAIVPRPRGGDWLAEDVAALKAAWIDVLVSLLEPDEVLELGLAEESRRCSDAGIAFLSLPVPDGGVPERPQEFLALAEDLRLRVAAGRTVGVHCRAGIGRSSLLAAAILVLSGASPEEARNRVSAARGSPFRIPPSSGGGWTRS